MHADKSSEVVQVFLRAYVDIFHDLFFVKTCLEFGIETGIFCLLLKFVVLCMVLMAKCVFCRVSDICI